MTEVQSVSILDRTEELSFEAVDSAAALSLIANGVLVLKQQLAASELEGPKHAYIMHRRVTIPRRAAGRAVRAIGGDTKLYRKLRVSTIAADPRKLPWYMKSAQPVVDTINKLDSELFEFSAITDIYSPADLNIATFFASEDSDAVKEHQDSRGATNLAYAPQLHPTLWQIHTFDLEDPTPPAPVAYTFQTEPGDIVALTQRRGPAPAMTPKFGESAVRFSKNSSLIHSCVRLSAGRRFGMGIFYQEVAEQIT